MSPAIPALLVTLAALLVGVCVQVCYRCYRRHAAAELPDEVWARLRRSEAVPAPGDDAPSEVRAAFDARHARTRAEGVLALNELTSEIKYALDDARTLPRAVSRIGLLGATALGLLALSLGLKAETGSAGALWGAVCFALGLAAAVVCGLLGRMTLTSVRRRRDRVEELIRALERHLPAPVGEEPTHSDEPSSLPAPHN